ncbi:MAG TPA: DUF3800 domain-containing protein [Candidatus Baltobacteraceae bacterium]|nr:DUF3800 domain-containing protein [Candidatus Baltobacteraceae bacterium]
MNDLYVFVDESGNFDFSANGSTFFVLSAVVSEDPVQGVSELLRWRHHILAGGGGAPATRKPRDCTHFHCSEDEQYTRDGVFEVIRGLAFDAYSVIVQKNKTNASIRDQDLFYQRTFKGLLPYIVRRHGPREKVHVFVSQITLKSKKAAVVAALKAILNAEKTLNAYDLHFHPNHSHHMLQVSDYVCWAIARKWESSDTRSHALIATKIRSEFDMFSRGRTIYY